MRHYRIDRDGDGNPFRMVWMGDTPQLVKLTKAQQHAERQRELYERVMFQKQLREHVEASNRSTVRG
jgi:hypothetical protein